MCRFDGIRLACRMGTLRQLRSQELRAAFQDPGSADRVVELADSFAAAVRDGTHRQKGWSDSMYGISKLAEVSYTLWLSRELAPQVRQFGSRTVCQF